MLEQDSGQALAIACKATRISKGHFTTIYLLTSRVRGNRLISEKNISRAIAYYNKISGEMARDLMSAQRH